jgi:hypothetical protein
MRVLAITAMATALLTMPAQAQAPTVVPGQAPWSTLPKMNNSAPSDEHPVTKADDRAYKAALDRIPPSSKQSSDPWSNVREKPLSNNSR